MDSSSGKMSRQIERLLETAQRHSEKGRFEKALAAYRELAGLEPGKIKHWLTIGYLEGKRGNIEQAASIYRQVGNYYDSRGKTEKAIAVFRQVLAPCPWDTAIHLKLAELQLKKNRPTESWEHYRQALALLLREGQRVEAVQVLGAMTELAADNVALWIRLAETAVSAGILERGVSAFTTALGLLRQQGRTEEYIRVAERLSGLTPEDLYLIRDLGAQYLELGDVASALARLHRCYDADPQDVRTLNLLVDAFVRLPDRDKAVNALRLVADIHQDRGEAEEHALACQRLFELDPSLAPASNQPPEDDEPDEGDEGGTLLEVGILLREAAGYTKIGLFDGAADVLHQARVLDPGHEEVFERLKTAYLKLGSVDDAVALLVDHAERLVDRAPERATALLDEAQELNADHPAVFRARMGPLDPHELDSRPAEAASAPKAPASRRYSDEGTSMRLLSDIKSVTGVKSVTAVTVKRPLPPDVTARIKVDDLERTLHKEQRLREQGREDKREDKRERVRLRPGGDDARPGAFGESTALTDQTSSPAAFGALTTAEMNLTELHEILSMDAATGDQSTPAQDNDQDPFKPEATSPNALALSPRWRHIKTHGHGD